MQFLYWIPKHPNPITKDNKLIDDLDLRKTIGDEFESRTCQSGPDGTAGQIITRDIIETPKTESKYKQSEQQWIEWRGYWIGYWKTNPPTPKDLIRAKPLISHPVKMRDGNEWNIPIARRFNGTSVFPSVVFENKDGEIIREVDDEYKFFVQAAEKEYKVFLNDNNLLSEDEKKDIDPFTDNELMDIVCNLLNLNYHISKPEITLLKLFTDKHLIQCLQAMIDLPTIYKFISYYDEENNTFNQSEKKNVASTEIGQIQNHGSGEEKK